MSSIEVIWHSPRTKTHEVAFGHNLDAVTANNLYYKITHYGPWPELKDIIEAHEGSPISYFVTNVTELPDTIQIRITVSAKP